MDTFVPCVVFTFNRPDKLQLVLSALKRQNIDRLIVFVDGPRSDADIEQVEQCRSIAQRIDWADKEIYAQEQNCGLSGLADNIATVLSKYSSAVFVEDDLLTMPDFYSFMRQALTHYEFQDQVFSIGGYQPISQGFFEDYPYSLVSCARFMCCGWATWRDRWNAIEPYRIGFAELFDGLHNVPDVAGSDLAGIAQAVAQGTCKSWATQVAIATLRLGKVHLLPTRGLVRNIGMCGDGTHDGTHDAHLHNQNVSENLPENILWLENVELNEKYTEKFKQFINECDRPPKRTFWHRVKAWFSKRISA